MLLPKPEDEDWEAAGPWEQQTPSAAASGLGGADSDAGGEY